MLARIGLVGFQYEHHHDFDEPTADKDARPRKRKLTSSIGGFLVKNGWNPGVCSMCGESVETGEDREGSRASCMDCMARPCEFFVFRE